MTDLESIARAATPWIAVSMRPASNFEARGSRFALYAGDKVVAIVSRTNLETVDLIVRCVNHALTPGDV